MGPEDMEIISGLFGTAKTEKQPTQVFSNKGMDPMAGAFVQGGSAVEKGNLI